MILILMLDALQWGHDLSVMDTFPYIYTSTYGERCASMGP